LKIAKRILSFVFLVSLITLLAFLGIVTMLNPERVPLETLTIDNNQKSSLSLEDTFSVTTFNIGYAGLDKDQDFFFDGGEMGRSHSYDKTMDNLEGILNFLTETDSDFILFQELDRNSLRTYNTDQYKYFTDNLLGYTSTYAENYKAIWVPVPIFEPMGYVEAGMATFSKFQTYYAQRHNLEGQESWPMKLFEVDRCFIETIHPLPNGKDLVVVNIHLSAYDKGGELRSAQSTHLKRFIEEQFESGNYVIVGGDWNQLISSIQLEDPNFINTWPSWLVEIQADFGELGFTWGVSDIMTVRDLDTPYNPGVTFETIIDGFLISPNIEIVEVIGHDLGFHHSDHNPVTIVLKIE
jgi:endonuclease/exonuclease/phosphatase family metal-dependent hydrolase